MHPVPVLLSWSGGKDAAWTLQRLCEDPRCQVVGLVTTVTQDYARVSMQGIRRDVLHAQAAATGLPLVEAMIPARCDNTTYEAAFAEAMRRAAQRWPGLRTLAFGDLFLQDIRDWRVAFCTRHDWDVITPLFGLDTAVLAREMIAGGLRATLCCVDTTQLDERYAGRTFDRSLLAELPESVDPCGENGEFHTCVWAGPMFAAPLRLVQGETVLRDGRFAYTDFQLARSPVAL